MKHTFAIRLAALLSLMTLPISAQSTLACPPDIICAPLSMAASISIEPDPTPRDLLIAQHIQYFQVGIGVHPLQHLPVESVDSLGQIDSRTQPTLIGFYLQILGAVVKQDLHPPFLTRAQAIAESDQVLSKLLTIQQLYGWDGLIPWMYLDPLVPSSATIGFVDNANLSQSVAVFIGALEGTGNFSQKASLLQKANQFLQNQQNGYQSFYSAQTGKFHGSYDQGTRQFHATYYIDRFMNEARSAVAFVILRYGISAVAWNSLQVVSKNYQLENGEVVENLVPFDGSAFQMFWSSMVANEGAVPRMRQVLNNYFLTQLDFAKRNKLAGITSACLIPEGVYYGKAGTPSAQETVDPLLADVGSVYALASAYNVNPSAVIAWMDSIRTQAPLSSGAFGFFDSARTANDVSNTYLGIDQGAIVIGLTSRSGSYFDAYLQNRLLLVSFRQLYESKLPELSAVQSAVPGAPDIWTRATTVFRNSYSEGTLNNFQNPTSYPHGITFNYQNVSGSTWGGHYWLLNAIDARGKTLVVSFTSRISPGEVKVELKSGNTVRLTQTVTIPQTDALGSVRISIPNNSNYSAITTVSVIIEPWRTGIRTANFTVHQLGFYTD